MTLEKEVLREPYAKNLLQYRMRVHRLVLIYVGLFVICVNGIGIILWNGKFFVTLAQRSNVETLTILFLLVFFSYLISVSFQGAVGSLQILKLYLMKIRGMKREELESEKMRILRQSTRSPVSAVAALNFLIERDTAPYSSFEIEIRDPCGSMGVLRIDGARVEHWVNVRDGSSNFLAFVVEQMRQIKSDNPVAGNLDIVEWGSIDDEATAKYLSMTKYTQNLARHLGATELWPKITLTESEVLELRNRLSRLCHILRIEALLPQWDYQGEHKLPIIPEPLGIISLNRGEKRVDPVASLGAALIISSLALVLLILFTVRPPWVPGT